MNDNYRRLCGSLAWLSTLSLPEERAAGAWFLAKVTRNDQECCRPCRLLHFFRETSGEQVFQQQTEGSQDNDEQAQNFKNHAIIRTHVLHWVSVQLQGQSTDDLISV